MQAWIVRKTTDSQHGNRGSQQTVVHADNETQARERGAEALGVTASAVTAFAYDGPTLGSLVNQ